MHVLRVDVAPFKHFLLAGTLSILSLTIALIIGGAGPKQSEQFIYSAYDCPGGSHTWSNICQGVQLKDNHTWWIKEFPPINLENRYWTLSIQPYYDTNPQVAKLEVNVVVEGRNAGETEEWIEITNSAKEVETERCPANAKVCTDSLLVMEQLLDWNFYRVRVNFPDSSNSYWVSDVVFTLEQGTKRFTTEEIILRFLFLALVTAVFSYYMCRGHPEDIKRWPWEQKGCLIILVGMFFYNNPLFGFQYAVRGWFFPFMESFFHAAIHSVFLLFWLFAADRIRSEEKTLNPLWNTLPKSLLVALFGVLEMILFAIITIRDEVNPTYGSSPGPVQIMYYVVSFLWCGIIMWVFALVCLAVPIVMRKRYLLVRFLFSSIPMLVVIFSMLVGILIGAFGPLGKSALSFVYFLTLYNTYVFLLCWGYWPVDRRFRDSNPVEATETTRLAFSTGKEQSEL